MIMLCRPMWPFLFMYGSHDMRHTSFPQVDSGQRNPREMGRHNWALIELSYVALDKLSYMDLDELSYMALNKLSY